jgi:hypothetical protein
MSKRIGIATTTLVVALAFGGLTPVSASANGPLACYKVSVFVEMTEAGNWKNNRCTESAGILKGEFVEAEPVTFVGGTLWCAKITPLVKTGTWATKECSIKGGKEVNSEWIEVTWPGAKLLPEFSVKTNATGTSGKGSLNLEGTSISCEKGTSTIGATNKKEGTFRINFSGCKSGGKSCISLGQTAVGSTVETTGAYQVVSLASNRSRYEMLFNLAAADNTEALHLECESAAVGLVLVWGSFLGAIEEKSGTTYKVIVETEGGGSTVKQKITTFGNNSGTEVKVGGLKGKLGSGTERKAGESSEENLLAMAAGTTLLES